MTPLCQRLFLKCLCKINSPVVFGVFLSNQANSYSLEACHETTLFTDLEKMKAILSSRTKLCPQRVSLDYLQGTPSPRIFLDPLCRQEYRKGHEDT